MEQRGFCQSSLQSNKLQTMSWGELIKAVWEELLNWTSALSILQWQCQLSYARSTAKQTQTEMAIAKYAAPANQTDEQDKVDVCAWKTLV